MTVTAQDYALRYFRENPLVITQAVNHFADIHVALVWIAMVEVQTRRMRLSALHAL